MRLRARDAERWTSCSASAIAPDAEVSRDLSDGALEADAANWVAGMLIKGEVSEPEELVGRVAPLGWTVTDEIGRHARAFANVLIENEAEYDDAIQFPGVQIFGGWMAVQEGHVSHYRMAYGWEIVEPFKNAELMLRAAATSCERYDMTSLVIFQPRPYHPDGKWRRWSVGPEQIKGWQRWFTDRVMSAGSRDARAGEHCVGCEHVGRCQAARVVSYEAMERCRGAGRLAEAPADELARELHHGATALRIMQARQEELEREAEARLRSGEWVPQYYLDDVPGKRELAVTPDIAEMLTGVRATKTVRRSPADMERDGADPAVMRTISRASRGRQRLARFTKKDADRMFSR